MRLLETSETKQEQEHDPEEAEWADHKSNGLESGAPSPAGPHLSSSSSGFREWAPLPDKNEDGDLSWDFTKDKDPLLGVKNNSLGKRKHMDDDGQSEGGSETSFDRMIAQSQQRGKELRLETQKKARELARKELEATQHFYRQPKLYHTLVVCALALMYLRAPIMLSDLRRWVRNGQLPYMSAYAHLPERFMQQLGENELKTLKARVCTTIFLFSFPDRVDFTCILCSTCPSRRCCSRLCTSLQGGFGKLCQRLTSLLLTLPW